MKLPKRDGLLVLLMPSAPQFSGLVPDLLDLRVVLHHDGVLEECARTGISTISIEAIFYIRQII